MEQNTTTYTQEEEQAIELIIQNWNTLVGKPRRSDNQSLRIMLMHVHENSCPLDFVRLSQSDNRILSHDISGMRKNIDIITGALLDGFRPYCAKRLQKQS